MKRTLSVIMLQMKASMNRFLGSFIIEYMVCMITFGMQKLVQQYTGVHNVVFPYPDIIRLPKVDGRSCAASRYVTFSMTAPSRY